jgi:hypothetical protein
VSQQRALAAIERLDLKSDPAPALAQLGRHEPADGHARLA